MSEKFYVKVVDERPTEPVGFTCFGSSMDYLLGTTILAISHPYRDGWVQVGTVPGRYWVLAPAWFTRVDGESQKKTKRQRYEEVVF